MLYLVVLVFLLYCIILVGLSSAWRKLVSRKGEAGGRSHRIAVVVPVRNEADNIANLLNDLAHQTYPHLEIVVVDDHSTDGTRATVSSFINQIHHLQVVINPGVGKKKALTAGVMASNADIIVTIDADCRVHPGWIETINEKFHGDTTHLCIGLVRMESHDLFSQMQAIEFASVVGTGLSAYAWGNPLYCNGANLAFRKKTFLEVDGYQGNFEVASGDDEFLMRKIKQRYPDGISTVIAQQSVVTTQPNGSMVEFFNQRIRWASKWRFADVSTQWIAVILVLVHIVVFCSMVALFAGYEIAILGSLWLIKFVVDYMFLSRVCRTLQVPCGLLTFALLQLTYSFYVVSIGVLSNFVSYRWKERTLSTPVRRA